MAPAVSSGHSENEWLADFHISFTAAETTFGSPWPPHSDSAASAVQPLSAKSL
jgi:hypothetical protein